MYMFLRNLNLNSMFYCNFDSCSYSTCNVYIILICIYWSWFTEKQHIYRKLCTFTVDAFTIYVLFVGFCFIKMMHIYRKSKDGT